ncbi:hypothetical protein ACFL20_05455 [Spirochaetota bacterium]
MIKKPKTLFIFLIVGAFLSLNLFSCISSMLKHDPSIDPSIYLIGKWKRAGQPGLTITYKKKGVRIASFRGKDEVMGWKLQKKGKHNSLGITYKGRDKKYHTQYFLIYFQSKIRFYAVGDNHTAVWWDRIGSPPEDR